MRTFIFCATIFGRISPKSNNKNVTKTPVKRNFNVVLLNLKRLSITIEEQTTIEIFTKLFTTSIVASNESLFESNFKTLSAASEFRCFKPRISAGESEKKATSDDDIIADIINKTTVTTIKKILPVILS